MRQQQAHKGGGRIVIGECFSPIALAFEAAIAVHFLLFLQPQGMRGCIGTPLSPLLALPPSLLPWHCENPESWLFPLLDYCRTNSQVTRFLSHYWEDPRILTEIFNFFDPNSALPTTRVSSSCLLASPSAAAKHSRFFCLAAHLSRHSFLNPILFLNFCKLSKW